MKNFLFQTVPVLHFGEGCLTELPGQIAALRASRPMIVTDKGIVAAGLIAPVEKTLSDAGLEVAIFDSVVADPPEAIVLQAIDAAKAAKADIIIGLGGAARSIPPRLLPLSRLTARSRLPTFTASARWNARACRPS